MVVGCYVPNNKRLGWLLGECRRDVIYQCCASGAVTLAGFVKMDIYVSLTIGCADKALNLSGSCLHR